MTLAHVKTADDRKSALLAWAAQGGLDALKTAAETWTRTAKKYNLTEAEIEKRRGRFARAYQILSGESANRVIAGYEAAKKATTAAEIVRLIRENGLTHEMIPTQFKTEACVWEALLEKMPMTAMVRNLGVMSKVGLLKPLSNASKIVISRLNDQEYLRKSKIHPMQLMLARGTYSQGHGFRGQSTWTVVHPVVDALEAAFYKAFVNVVPTGKAFYIGLDISGSMGCEFSQGSGITCAEAGAALCLVTAKTGENAGSAKYPHDA